MIPKKQFNVVPDPFTIHIRSLLTDKGIASHQQARVVANIVGLEMVSVQQKFSGRRSWTSAQRTLLEQKLAQPGLMLSPSNPIPLVSEDKVMQHKPARKTGTWNAILKLSNIPQRCILERGHMLENPALENLVAIKEPEGWVVIPGSKAPEERPAFKVIQMTPWPAPRIAALDDRADIPDGIAALFSRQGIQVSAFSDVESLLEVVRVQPFEAYILDWSINTNETSEPAIEYIREVQKSNVPITILTGELRTQQTVGSDIARMVERYKVSILEKPAMLEILVKTFYNILFQIPIQDPRSTTQAQANVSIT